MNKTYVIINKKASHYLCSVQVLYINKVNAVSKVAYISHNYDCFFKNSDNGHYETNDLMLDTKLSWLLYDA